MLESWWSVLPAVFAGALMLMGPGLLALVPLRLRPLPWIALSAPISVACLAAAGLLSGIPGIRYFWPEPFVFGVVIALLLEGLICWRKTQAPTVKKWWKTPQPLIRRRILLVTCWAVAVFAFVLVLFRSVHSPDQFSQTYDNVFHLNATESILRYGDASTLHLRRLTEPRANIAMYPSAWHTAAASVVQLTSVAVPVAFNGLAIAVAAVVWIPGIGWLAALLSPLHQRTTTTACALLLSTALGFYPAALLIWGVLYPMYMAVSLIPTGIGLLVLLLRELSGQRGPTGELDIHPRLALAASLPLWVLAAFCAHPRSLISALVVALPLLVCAVWRALRTRWRTHPERRRRLLAWLIACGVAILGIAAALATFVYIHYDLAHRPIADHLTGVQARPTETLWSATLQVLSLSSPTGVGTFTTWPLIPLALVFLVCAIWLVVSRHPHAWLTWSFVLVGALYVLAAGTDSDLAKILTGFWYKDRYRLSALLPILVIVIVSVALPQLCTRARWPLVAAWTAAGVLALSSWMTLAPALGQSMRMAYRLPASDPTVLVDGQEATLLRQLPDLVPAGQRILGDPWNGTALSWALGNREPVFPHLSGAWSADQITVATKLDQLRTSPEVCRALHRLNVQYVFDSPRALNGGGDPAEAQYASIQRAINRGLLTPVRRSGDNVLYRITSCR